MSLTLTARAADLRAHVRGRLVDVVTTASVDDEPAWESVSTYLSRSPTPGTTDSSSTAQSSLSSTASADHSSTAAAGSAPSVDAGAVGGRANGSGLSPTATWRVPARVGSDYAAVSGDRNPIHTSRVGARLFGFPQPIAHGMWSMARCLAAIEGRLPESYTVDARFRQPILLPATVSFAYADGAFELTGRKPHLAGQVTPA